MTASDKEPIAKSIATSYIARFLNVAALFILLPVVSNQVGATAYGVYLLVTSVATLFQMDLGMANATVRFIAMARAVGDQIEVRKTIASSAVFFIVLGILGAAILGAVLAAGWDSFSIPRSYKSDAMILVGLVALQMVIGTSFSVRRHILTGFGRLDLANATQIAQVAIRLSLTLVVLGLGGGIVMVGVADTLAVIFGAAFGWVVCRRKARGGEVFLSQATWTKFRGMLQLSLDLLVLSVAALVILQSGSIIVSLTLPIAAVAVFASGYRIFQVCRELTNALTGALLPWATRLHISGLHDRNRALYLIGTKYANIVMLLAVVPVAVYARPLMTAWAGPELAEGYVVAQILLVSLIANNHHLVAVPILTAQGSVRGYAILHTIWAIVSISVGFLLAPSMGVAGVALAIALPVTLLEPLYIGIVLRRLDASWAQFAKSTLLPSLGMLSPLILVVWLVARFWTGDSVIEISVVTLGWAFMGSIAFWQFGMDRAERSSLIAFIRPARRSRSTAELEQHVR